ncbi:MAG TPA: glycosyltransferase family 39 protein [Nitrososphaerales archaeon]|nr:glycosyltransferase family 39 protein [Nitrososphaerales archaeon]
MRAANHAAQSIEKPGSRLLSTESLTSNTALLAYLGLADFIAHIAFAWNYGYFRDELYYIVSGTQHLSLGYVDFPPLAAWVAAVLYPLTGDSLVSIHVVSALIEAFLVFVSGMIARELGGGRRAQLLTAAATLLTLTFLADGSEFSPDIFDQLWWSLLAYVVVRTVRRREPKLWAVAGLVIGIGLLSKLTMFFFAGALLLSFLLVPSGRTYLKSKWVLVGGLLAALLFLPELYWNAVNGWPTIQFYLSFGGDVGAGPLGFAFPQLEEPNPLNVPLLLLGIWFYLRSDGARGLKALGLAYVILFVFMTALGMKPYYLAPIYPMLYAGGAVVAEKGLTSRRSLARVFGSRPWVLATLLIAVLLAPLIVPILQPAALIGAYGASTVSGVNGGVASGETGPLPQNLGDRLGWPQMVSSVAQVYESLPPAEKGQACIFTSNYGEAGALILLGKGMGLPPVISGHNNFWVWGPGSCTGKVLITVGVPYSTLKQAYATVSNATTITCEYCMDLENNVPVLVGTGPTFASITAEWASVRHYD